MKRIGLALWALVLVLGLSGVASSEPRGKDRQHDKRGPRRGAFKHWLSTIDTNRDGRLSRAETDAVLQREFGQADKDRDRQLTRQEAGELVKSHAAAHKAERFATMDKNKDGRVVKSEVPRMPERRFQELDQNRDAALSRDEFVAKGGGPKFARGIEVAFMLLDRDKNGRVSQAELSQKKDELFRELDTNKDGVLDRHELRGARRLLRRG